MHRPQAPHRYAAIAGILLLVLSVCVLSIEAKTATFHSPQQHLSKHCKAPEVPDHRVDVAPAPAEIPLASIDLSPRRQLPATADLPAATAAWISPAHSLRAPPPVR